jgi:hypothetical protein
MIRLRPKLFRGRHFQDEIIILRTLAQVRSGPAESETMVKRWVENKVRQPRKHTIARGRRQLLDQDVEVGRIRQSGAGRKPVEKKRLK